MIKVKPVSDNTYISFHGRFGGFTITTEIDVGDEESIDVVYKVKNPRAKEPEEDLENQDWFRNKIHIFK